MNCLMDRKHVKVGENKIRMKQTWKEVMKMENEVERRVEGKRREEDKLNETKEQKEAGPSGSHRLPQ